MTNETSSVGSMETIIDQLRDHETRLASKLEQLSNDVQQIDNELNQVRSAIRSLDSSEPAAKKSGHKRSRRAPSLSEVERVIQNLRSSHPQITEQQLYEKVESQILAGGRTKHGLRAKFNQLMKGQYLAQK